MLMAKRGQIEMAELCYAAVSGDDARREFVNCHTDSEWSALMTAAENNQAGFCKWLIERGGYVNHAMVTGWTAAHAAAKRGHVGVLRMLLESGADRHIQATHKEFGRNLECADVTVNPAVLELLDKYP